MINPVAELRAFAQAALLRPTPRDHQETDAAVRRRRIVAAITLIAGSALLALSLRVPPGDDRFYLLTTALAAVWTVGAFTSGPLHLGRAWTRVGHLARPTVQSFALAAVVIAVFVAGALVVARIPVLGEPLNALLDHARYGSLPLVWLITAVNGVGEELFFRGALFAAAGRGRPVAITTAIYTMTTLVSGVPLLTVAGLILGFLTGLQRRVTGGVLGPIILHVTWSSAMLVLLPPLLNAPR